MTSVFRCVLAGVVATAATVPAYAAPAMPQQPPTSQTPQKPDPQKPDPQKPKDPPKPDETKPPTFEELVVVSGSNVEQKVINAPATMSVITAAQIETVPNQNFAELLRSVPGLNITQVSARDINVTSRSATGTLATGQLALLDGRSIYQDFFGFVMWDFLPVNLNEVKQIEVIRGPASAVWGANALNGVVNVITKSPREMQGTSAVLGFGGLDRTDGDGGSLWYVSGTHAQALNDRWAFKLSGGGYVQDAPSRPAAGTPIPCTFSSVCTSPRRAYPGFNNAGTAQPKFDARVDYDYPDDAVLSFAGGVAGTEGIMHSGIGPFDIDQGSTMSYAKANYGRGGFRAGFFTNILNGDATNLLTIAPTGAPITFAFKTKTFDFEAANVQTFGQRHVVNYGGNLRFNTFELELAPESENRTEFGIYGQDEIFLSRYLRLSVGARVDRFDYLDDFVFSPRVALLIKPQEDQTLRLSFNRAYRSPSVVNNFLDVTIAEPIPLGQFHPFFAGQVYQMPVRSVGNQDLQEQSVDAWEVSYTGVVRERTVFNAAWYYNKTKNDINFTEVPEGRYTSANPPPGWPPLLIPAIDAARAQGAVFPGLFTYLNLGTTKQKGLEVGVDSAVSRYLNVFANYSYQAEPEPEGFALTELNIPAENRFNTGIAFNYSRFLSNLSISYSDAAFWQDVLDVRYSGTTEAYTLVNATFGVKWAGDRVTTSIKAVNLTNEDIQQHIFGDIMKRQLMFEMRVNFIRRQP